MIFIRTVLVFLWAAATCGACAQGKNVKKVIFYDDATMDKFDLWVCGETTEDRVLNCIEYRSFQEHLETYKRNMYSPSAQQDTP